MGIPFTETIIEIWNRFIGRKKDASKKGKRKKNVSRKHKERDQGRQAPKKSCRHRLLSQEAGEEEGK